MGTLSSSFYFYHTSASGIAFCAILFNFDLTLMSVSQEFRFLRSLPSSPTPVMKPIPPTKIGII